jgi:hypothetical protein
VIAWTVAICLVYLVIFGLNLPEVYAGIPPSPEVNAIYGGFHRLTWAVAVGWMVFACCRGYGGKPCVVKQLDSVESTK